MRRLLMAGLVISVAALVAAGCDTFFPGEDSGGKENPELAAYGGYTTTDEAPGFGDPALVARHPEDTPYNDDMASSPEVRNAAGNGGAKFYMLRMVWGNIDSPDTSENEGPCAVSDWSGSADVEGGVLIIRRLIHFEPDDSIVRPRRGSRGVDWVSHTRNHLDGLLIQIIDVPDPRHKEVANSITITTPFFTREIPFSDLASLDQEVTYDECNKISLVGTALEKVRCPRGFLEGAWISETDTSGTFEGAWIADEGSLTGLVEGRYGMDDTVRVLYGKWITPAGEFGGLLRGTWGLATDDGDDEDEIDEAGPDGYFEGVWANSALEVAGRFHGHFSFPTDAVNGMFRGRWFKDCK
jgi:hypothetical protein